MMCLKVDDDHKKFIFCFHNAECKSPFKHVARLVTRLSSNHIFMLRCTKLFIILADGMNVTSYCDEQVFQTNNNSSYHILTC